MMKGLKGTMQCRAKVEVCSGGCLFDGWLPMMGFCYLFYCLIEFIRTGDAMNEDSFIILYTRDNCSIFSRTCKGIKYHRHIIVLAWVLLIKVVIYLTFYIFIFYLYFLFILLIN